MRLKPLAALALLAAPALRAQNPPQPDPCIWDGPRLFHLYRAPLARLEREEAGKGIVQQVLAPEATLHMDVVDGAYWATTGKAETVEGKAQVTMTVLKREPEGKAWEKAAVWHPKYKGHALVPLKEGGFLAVTSRLEFPCDRGFAPFAVLKPDAKGVLHPESPMDPGLELPLWKKTAPDAFGNGQLNYPGLSMALGTSTILRVPGFVVVSLDDVGYFWVFDDATGAMKRRIALFPSVDEALLKAPGPGLAYVLLGLQPRPDGHLLVASRTEDAVLQSAKAYPYSVNEAVLQDRSRLQAELSKVKAMMDLNLKNFPFIAWWDLNPATGEVRPEAAPANFPDRILNTRELWNFNWTFKADGNLVRYDTPKFEGANPCADCDRKAPQAPKAKPAPARPRS